MHEYYLNIEFKCLNKFTEKELLNNIDIDSFYFF